MSDSELIAPDKMTTCELSNKNNEAPECEKIENVLSLGVNEILTEILDGVDTIANDGDVCNAETVCVGFNKNIYCADDVLMEVNETCDLQHDNLNVIYKESQPANKSPTVDNSNTESNIQSTPMYVIDTQSSKFKQRQDEWTSDSDCSSSDESTSSISKKSVRSDTDSSLSDCITVGKKNDVKKPNTRVDYGIDDLPPIEDLKISVDKEEIIKMGQVSNIIGKLVLIESSQGFPALDIDTVLFLSDGKPFGQVFDLVGRVSEPQYVVRFNMEEDIEKKEIVKGTEIFCAVKRQELTSFVFLDQLKKERGSDASWWNNFERPNRYLDYSDDEEERAARRGRKNRKKQEGGSREDGEVSSDDNDSVCSFSTVASEQTEGRRGRGRGFRGTRGSARRGWKLVQNSRGTNMAAQHPFPTGFTAAGNNNLSFATPMMRQSFSHSSDNRFIQNPVPETHFNQNRTLIRPSNLNIQSEAAFGRPTLSNNQNNVNCQSLPSGHFRPIHSNQFQFGSPQQLSHRPLNITRFQSNVNSWDNSGTSNSEMCNFGSPPGLRNYLPPMTHRPSIRFPTNSFPPTSFTGNGNSSSEPRFLCPASSSYSIPTSNMSTFLSPPSPMFGENKSLYTDVKYPPSFPPNSGMPPSKKMESQSAALFGENQLNKLFNNTRPPPPPGVPSSEAGKIFNQFISPPPPPPGTSISGNAFSQFLKLPPPPPPPGTHN